MSLTSTLHAFFIHTYTWANPPTQARLLLQQARQRGQVTIVVASHSPTSHKEGEGRAAERDKGRDTEDVVLRPKKKSKFSIVVMDLTRIH